MPVRGPVLYSSEEMGVPNDAATEPVENSAVVIGLSAGVKALAPLLLLNVGGNCGFGVPATGVSSEAVCADVRSKFKNTMVSFAGTMMICGGAGVDCGEAVGVAPSNPYPDTTPYVGSVVAPTVLSIDTKSCGGGVGVGVGVAPDGVTVGVGDTAELEAAGPGVAPFEQPPLATTTMAVIASVTPAATRTLGVASDRINSEICSSK